MIGIIGLLLSMSVLIPQIIKTAKTKQVEDLSSMMYVQLALACIFLMIKAYVTGAYFFIISYAITLTSALIMLYLIKRYKCNM